MARGLYGIEKGLRLYKENADHGAGGDTIDYLFGAGAPPGTSGETDDAKIGSLYSNTTNGDLYRKVADTSSASDWNKMDEISPNRKQLTGVVAAAQTLDSILVDDILATEWEVHMRDDATPASVKVLKIIATHDGHSGADATDTDDSVFAKLKVGSNFSTNVEVDLDGAGAAQTMRLRVTGQVGGVTFTSRRTDITDP